MEGSSSLPPNSNPKGASASKYLTSLPSRGLFSSTVISSNLGGLRGYMCEHNTSPPENQVIKTNQTNILIRSLTIKKDGKATPSTEVSKKRAALPMDSKSKRAMTNSRQEGSSTRTPVKEFLGLTVERLRALLKDRGLSTKGKKDELIARLKST